MEEGDKKRKEGGRNESKRYTKKNHSPCRKRAFWSFFLKREDSTKIRGPLLEIIGLRKLRSCFNIITSFYPFLKYRNAKTWGGFESYSSVFSKYLTLSQVVHICFTSLPKYIPLFLLFLK